MKSRDVAREGRAIEPNLDGECGYVGVGEGRAGHVRIWVCAYVGILVWVTCSVVVSVKGAVAMWYVVVGWGVAVLWEGELSDRLILADSRS